MPSLFVKEERIFQYFARLRERSSFRKKSFSRRIEKRAASIINVTEV